MPRKIATKTIDIIGKPDSIPVNEFPKFRESRIASQLFQIIKTPVWDSVGDSLEDFYLAARREHEAMLHQKGLLIEHQRLQNLANKTRLRRLYRTQANLKNRFIEVNVFLREFMEKRKGAIKRGYDQMAIQKEITASNDAMRNAFDVLLQFRDMIAATKDEYEPYEIVLEDVVKQSSDFKSVKELMDRCDALMLAQVEISELGHIKNIELEIMRKRLVAIANAAALQILGLKNALSNVDRLYEAGRNEVLKWEKINSQVRNAIIEGQLKKDRVHDSIDHLYRLLCARRSIYPDIMYNAVAQRLDFIKDEVEIMQSVLSEKVVTNQRAATLLEIEC